MKVKTMVDSVEALSKLMDCGMTARAALRVSVNAKRIEEIVIPLKEQEVKIYQKYGVEKETDQGPAWIVQDEDSQKVVRQEIQELLDDDIEITILQISSSDITGNVTPRDLIDLVWLFDDLE